MTQPKTALAYLRNEKAKAEQKLRSCQHREKILERRMSELNQRERVHRLCTRAGMLESFLVCPGELTDDQVMEHDGDYRPCRMVSGDPGFYFCFDGVLGLCDQGILSGDEPEKGPYGGLGICHSRKKCTIFQENRIGTVRIISGDVRLLFV